MYANQKTLRLGSGFQADFQPCLCIDEDISGSAETIETTQSDAWLLRSKLIEDYRNAKPRSNRRCLIEAELRRVTHEVLRA